MNERPSSDFDADGQEKPSASPRDDDRTGRSAEPEIGRNVKSRTTWLRLFFMIVLAVLYGVAEFVMTVVVVVQFFFALLTGGPNERLREFGRALAMYSYQILLFLTYNTEERPFPFDLDWPDPDEPL